MKKQLAKIFLCGLGLVAAGAYAQVTPVTFEAIKGDNADACPTGSAVVSANVGFNYKAEVCRAIGDNPSTRLGDGASMSNAAAGCRVSLKDSKPQPVTICETISFKVNSGDGTCPSGMRLATVKEAALFNVEACKALASNQWYIARLANGGSIGGSGYSCGVTMENPDKLGDSLCVSGK